MALFAFQMAAFSIVRFSAFLVLFAMMVFLVLLVMVSMVSSAAMVVFLLVVIIVMRLVVVIGIVAIKPFDQGIVSSGVGRSLFAFLMGLVDLLVIDITVCC